jgi:hypothetical protein
MGSLPLTQSVVLLVGMVNLTYTTNQVIPDRDDPSFDTHFECFAKHEFIRGVSYIQFDRLCSTDSSHSNRGPEFYLLAIANSFAIKYVLIS